jgi:hypothetical protein
VAIDATVAGTAANSYATVEEADLLALDDLGRAAADWALATLDTKERALKRATREIDAYVGTTEKYATDPEQALAFPRVSDVDSSGAAIIPSKLKLATYLQAGYVLRNADVLDEAASRRARGLVNFANPDGTGGQISTDPELAVHPQIPTLVASLNDASSGVYVIETT